MIWKIRISIIEKYEYNVNNYTSIKKLILVIFKRTNKQIKIVTGNRVKMDAIECWIPNYKTVTH